MSEIRSIMAEMKEITSAMLERVQVDLTGDEFSRLLQCFNICLWSDRSKHSELSAHVSRLGKYMKLNQRAAAEFCTCGKLLGKIWQTAKANKLSPSNRQAWSWILVPEWRCKVMPKIVFQHMSDLQELISFYLSLKTNTTTLERNLGELCRQLNSHSGPLSEDGATMANLLTVALDGPQRETDMFRRDQDSSTDKILHPTPFLQACAKLWVLSFGRRFQYKYRKGSEATQRPRESRLGSFASLQLRHGKAVRALCNASKSQMPMPSFVPGLELPIQAGSKRSSTEAVVGTRWGDPTFESTGSSGPGRKRKHPVLRFEEHTARKQARVWVLN